jgi:hypothetical protein
MRLVFDWQDHRISDNVVDEVCAHRGRKTQIVYLDWRRAMSENAWAAILCVAGQIYHNIKVMIIEKLGDLFVTLSTNIMKLIKCCDEPLSHLASVIDTE